MFLARVSLGMMGAALAVAQAPSAFEVASVRSAVPGTLGGRIQLLPGGRYSAINVALTYIIQQTYGLRGYQLTGPPALMKLIADGRDARYNIEAKAADASATEAQMREMVKTLLAGRFKLKVHTESRELPVYALVPAKSGAKLSARETASGEAPGTGAIALMFKGWLEGKNVWMSSFIEVLNRELDRPLIDRTDFTGAFKFRLTWTPDNAQPDASTGPGACPASFAAFIEQRHLKEDPMSCPSIFTAVQEQLGLKLDPQNAPVEMLVVDHVELPSGN